MKSVRVFVHTQTRRDFCVHACQAVSVMAAGALAGCGSTTSPSDSTPQLASVPSSVSSRTVSINVDAASPLAAVGSAAIAQTSIGNFLVFHDSQSAFTVMTAICTHEQCTVTGFTGSRFVCPCHGSQYTTSGSVATGPAPSALRQFPSQFSGTVLTFSA